MTTVFRGSLLAGLAVFSFVSSADAQGLPEAPGKDALIKVCGTCHEPQRSASLRLTPESWQEVIAKMVALGAKGTEEELAQILNYLVEHFKGEAPRPLNMNSATAIQLESVAGL